MEDAFEHMMEAARHEAHRTDVDTEDQELETQLVNSVKRSRNVADALEEDSPAVRHRLVGTPRTRGASPQRKRARSSGKTTDVLDRPGSITYDRFRHLLIVMAYAGLRPMRSSMTAIIRCSQRRPDPLIAEVEAAGMSWLDAYQVHDTCILPALSFMTTLRALSTHNNPSENVTTYSKLSKFMRMALNSYEFTAALADHALVTENEPCAVEGKPRKAREKMYRISVRMYEKPGADDACDYRLALPVGNHPIQFHINERYLDLILGTWYLYHLSYLVEHNCAAWVTHVRELPRRQREAIAPGFDAASDADLAHLYVAANHHACTEIHERVIRIAQSIEKRNQEYKKRLKKSDMQ